MCDHQLHLLGQSLSAEMRMSLKTTLLRDLILSGSDTCIALIISLILRYLEDVASTDAISEKLRQMLEMEKLDPHHRALQCYPAAVEALLARKKCYQQLCLVLQKLYTAVACHPQSPSVPKSPRPMVQTTPLEHDEGHSPLEAQGLADLTLSLALQLGDELCHIALFDWLTENKWDDKLLEI